MQLDTNIEVNFEELDKMLSERAIPSDGHTKLAMNDYTVYALTGKPFWQDRRQTYFGYPIIEDSWCRVGEIVVLVNYEYFRKEQ